MWWFFAKCYANKYSEFCDSIQYDITWVHYMLLHAGGLARRIRNRACMCEKKNHVLSRVLSICSVWQNIDGLSDSMHLIVESLRGVLQLVKFTFPACLSPSRVSQAWKTLIGQFNLLSVKLGFCSPEVLYSFISELLHVTLWVSVMRLLKWISVGVSFCNIMLLFFSLYVLYCTCTCSIPDCE